jgi:HTH-type transcriptional regulator/antitoxin HigA
MKTEFKILRTEAEYYKACERIYQLIHSSDNAIDPKSSEGEEMELLSLLVEKYEQENHAMGVPNPIEAIKFRMDQMNLKQVDIAPLFGGKTRVSEVLNGKRPLTLKMITLLNRYLGIPFESLIAGNKKYELSTKKQEEVLSVGAINHYYSTSKSLNTA